MSGHVYGGIAELRALISEAEIQLEQRRRNYRDAKDALDVATSNLAVLQKKLIAVLQRNQR